MAWKDAARRSLIGDQVVLASSGGALWIRPKKLSIEAMDAIRDIRTKAVASADRRDKMKRALRLQERHPGIFEGQGIDTLDTEDRLEVMDLYSQFQGGAKREFYRIALLHGIGEHNLTDDKGELIGRGQTLDAKTVDEVLEWGELAAEINQVIEAYNGPFRTEDRRDISDVTEWIFSGAQFGADSGELPDGRDPVELRDAWAPWVVECIDLMDADGAFRHFPYPGGRREQPAVDMEILRVIRQAWVRLMREDLERKYGQSRRTHRR